VCLTEDDPYEEAKDGSQRSDGGRSAPDLDGWRYVEQDPSTMEDIWARSAYFTVDTSYVLFRRTKWLKLQPADESDKTWSNFSYSAPPITEGVNREIEVEIAPPQVVLFETVELKPCSRDKRLPQTGFLIMDFRLKPKDVGDAACIYLEDILAFNDQVRCLWGLSEFENFKYAVLMGQCEQLYSPPRKFDKSTVAKWQQDKLADLRLECPANEGVAPVPIHHLSLWESAVLNPVARPNEKKKLWLIDRTMRDSARAWASRCTDKAAFANGSNCPIAGVAASMGSHTGWLATTDYRAYVWIFAYLEQSLSRRFERTPDRPEIYGHWVKFLNVDSPGGLYWQGKSEAGGAELEVNDTSSFERDWARARTYARWAHLDSYYGFTPHSGALLCASWNPHLNLGKHFRTMYFDQVLLLLYLRICAFDFSLHLARIGADLRDELRRRPNSRKVIEKHRKVFGEVRREFMSFVSLYQFPLLSTQQQGVEMYTLARQRMDVDELFRDIANEIDTADRVIVTHSGQNVSDRIELLTFLGLPIAVLSLILSGLTYLESKHFDWKSLMQILVCSLKFERRNPSALVYGILTVLLLLFVERMIWLIKRLRRR
jgi:hypothetical protein